MKMKLRDAIIGFVVGDALGVPVEFKSRSYFEQHPVTDMLGYGTHYQPKGTWSDDSSMLFCQMESLCNGYDVQDLANRFVNWYENAYWTPHGDVFDIGSTTTNALISIMRGVQPVTLAGGKSEASNGNGSLMRVLPLIFYTKNLDIQARWQHVADVSCLTHGHFRAQFACFIYLEYARLLLQPLDKYEAYAQVKTLVLDFANQQQFPAEEVKLFDRILQKNIAEEAGYNISGSGYVLHTLEAAFWCLLNHQNYKETVLAAVNLGLDTDTTGCVTGGLAGIVYGEKNIPNNWIQSLARLQDISDLISRLEKKLQISSN